MNALLDLGGSGDRSSPPTVSSLVIAGSGVLVVHRLLEAHLRGYRVEAVSPYMGLLPPLLSLKSRVASPITHSQPELGGAGVHPDSALVATFHNYYLDEEALQLASFSQATFYRTILAPAIALSLRRARWVTAVSHFVADLVQRRHRLGDRLVVIRNGIDTCRFFPAPRQSGQEVRILFAGNPIRRKGAEHLQALAEALPDGASLRYTAGTRASALQSPGQSGRLVPLPACPHEEMPARFQDADVLFFPTRREGFGLVVAEAMACGLPVVATRCSSIPELVDHGRGGYLFEMDDRAEMLRRLKLLIANPQLRAEMGGYNRDKIVSHFGIEKMLMGYRQLFESIHDA